VAAKSKLGRTRAVPAIAFRVTEAEREGLAALATAAGLSVNAMARARAVAGLPKNDGVTPSLVTNGNGRGPRVETSAEHGEVPR